MRLTKPCADYLPDVLSWTMRHKHKYGAHSVTRDGVRYDSKLEAAYAAKLDLAKQSGDLSFYLRQVRMDLPGGIIYRCDFVEFWASTGDVVFTDCKGYETSEFVIKKKLLEETYPIKLNIVKKS